MKISSIRYFMKRGYARAKTVAVIVKINTRRILRQYGRTKDMILVKRSLSSGLINL
jgi:hypothetical protein